MILSVPSGNFHLSGIPLWVKVEGANPPAGSSRYRALLRISSVDGLLKGSPFTDAVAPVDGVAWFDVSGYLERPDSLRFEWPLSGGLNPYPEWTLDIRFTAGESYIDSAGNLQESFGAESDTHYVVKGGVGPRRLGIFNDLGSSFYQYYVTGGRFLTHFPSSTKVAPFQPVKLWFLAGETGEQTLRIKAYYEDGSIYDYSSTNTFFRDIMHEINCLPYHADSINMPPVKSGGVRMTRYEVWIEGVSEVRTFYVDHSYRENSHYLLVANSLGGMDTVWLSGNTETGFESESIEAVRPFPRTGDGKERSVIVAARTGRKHWKINTGWKSRSEIEALSDVLLSRQAWLLESATGYNNGSLYPVTVKNTSSVLVNTSEDLLSLDIELSEAHNAQYL